MPTQPSTTDEIETRPIDTNEDDATQGDQDIDTAGTEHDEASVRHAALELPKTGGTADGVTAAQNPKSDRQDRNVEEPGDTNSADIVDRTGEQMPRQSHDGLEDEPERDAQAPRRQVVDWPDGK